MTREILNWIDKEVDDLNDDTNHPILKAMGLGLIEGIIDIGTVIAIPGIIYMFKGKK